MRTVGGSNPPQIFLFLAQLLVGHFFEKPFHFLPLQIIPKTNTERVRNYLVFAKGKWTTKMHEQTVKFAQGVTCSAKIFVLVFGLHNFQDAVRKFVWKRISLP
jgi:hypothetical protein